MHHHPVEDSNQTPVDVSPVDTIVSETGPVDESASHLKNESDIAKHESEDANLESDKHDSDNGSAQNNSNQILLVSGEKFEVCIDMHVYVSCTHACS